MAHLKTGSKIGGNFIADKPWAQNLLDDKVDKVTDKSLVLDTEIAKIHTAGSDNQDLSGLVEKETGKSLVADTEIAKIHSQNTDTSLDLGGTNPVTAANIKTHIEGTVSTHISTPLEAKNSGYLITFAELTSVPKVFTCESASDQTFTFAAPAAGDIGKQFWLVKTGTGAGRIILDCPANVYVDDSSSGGTATSAASARQSALFVVISTTQIQILSATGSWTTA